MFTSEFGSELEAERQQLLRRRFLWYTGTYVGWMLLILVPVIAYGAYQALWGEGEDADAGRLMMRQGLFTIPAGALSIALYIFTFHHVWRHRQTRWPLLKISHGLIVAHGLLSILSMAATTVSSDADLRQAIERTPEARLPGTIQVQTPDPGATAPPNTNPTAKPDSDETPAPNDPEEADTPEESPTPNAEPAADSAQKPAQIAAKLSKAAIRAEENRRSERRGKAYGLSWGIWRIFVAHLMACLFLPWTPSEAFRPLAPLLILNAVLALVYSAYTALRGPEDWGFWAAVIGILAFSPFVALPGVGIRWWATSRFRDEFTTKLLRGRYVEMRRELVDARRIHEALFPQPITEGPIRFNYFYEPMRQIGGDYLFAFQDAPGLHPTPRLSIVLLDVTGHGIPAALTVNRLYGELTRLFAETPWIAPGEVLKLLNRYVNLTLSNHSVYVTALCLRVDAAGDQIEYASGGHPPAYIKSVDGTLHELPSTSFVLGACPDPDFASDAAVEKFTRGDVLIAYTDGAIEARPLGGRMLGLIGFRRILSSSTPDGRGWPETIIRQVESYRQGPPEDDTLIVEIARAL
jgi:serine phosphatase RsbU (regulator of sigma subunit)